jgi:hypothetical protein
MGRQVFYASEVGGQKDLTERLEYQFGQLLAASTLMRVFTLSACNQSPDQVRAASCGSGLMNAAMAASSLQAFTQAAPGIPRVVQGIRTEGGELSITLSNRRTTQDCGDVRNVNINGFGDYITLTGSCHRVTLNGWGNTIHIEETDSIEVNGDSNVLIWERSGVMGKPVMQIEGSSNSVQHLIASR